MNSVECDVLIVGSGGAALASALTCSVGGLRTFIVEKNTKLGGTTSISSAGTWVPANHHARAVGLADSPEEALDYIRACAPSGWRESEDALWQRLVVEAPRMLEFLEQHTPLRFRLTTQSDPYAELPGGKACGRMLSPEPLSLHLIGRYGYRLRAPMLPHWFTYHEALALDPYHHPIAASVRVMPKLFLRWITHSRGMGSALIAGLLKGCIDHNCRVEPDTRALELSVNASSRVIGAVTLHKGETRRVLANRGVVLATGGFEWDPQLRSKHFPGPFDYITSPPGNEGDGHRMAAAVGAEFAHMDQANIGPGLPIKYEKGIQGLSWAFQREPNAIMVDKCGQRFANEFRFNIGEVLDERDPVTGKPLHLPAWVISDSKLLKRSPVVRWFSRIDSRWMVRNASIAGLAQAINVPEQYLLNSIERFNAFCTAGLDQDFGRTSTRLINGHGSECELAKIETPPFLAIPCNRSFIATKGGPRTNTDCKVLRADGSPIEGLYCVGVAMANPIGTWAVGAGTTIGPNMTWGYISGKSLLHERS